MTAPPALQVLLNLRSALALTLLLISSIPFNDAGLPFRFRKAKVANMTIPGRLSGRAREAIHCTGSLQSTKSRHVWPWFLLQTVYAD